MYKGVAIEFLVKGGDDFKDVINRIQTPRNVLNKGEYRSLL